MNILIDTHFVIFVADDRIAQIPAQLREVVLGQANNVFVSAASLWEVAIKSRAGKLPVRTEVVEWPGILESAGAIILPIDRSHIFASIDPQPVTRDPFDRLLLGVCAAEGMKLVTMDRALSEHHLAWRP